MRLKIVEIKNWDGRLWFKVQLWDSSSWPDIGQLQHYNQLIISIEVSNIAFQPMQDVNWSLQPKSCSCQPQPPPIFNVEFQTRLRVVRLYKIYGSVDQVDGGGGGKWVYFGGKIVPAFSTLKHCQMHSAQGIEFITSIIFLTMLNLFQF